MGKGIGACVWGVDGGMEWEGNKRSGDNNRKVLPLLCTHTHTRARTHTLMHAKLLKEQQQQQKIGL